MSWWRSKKKSDDLREKKVTISVTMTTGAIIYLQDNKQGHESRSNYLETLMWKGARQEELEKEHQAKDLMKTNG